MWCSIAEWILHKYLMHKAQPGFRYPYERHALIHHTIFKADESYHLQNEEDKHTISMAWWNGIAISAISSIPVYLIFGWKGYLLNFIVSMCYYFCYEITHWYMHLPKMRFIEKTSWFRKLNGHHLLHHRYTNRNYNVVLPLADLLFGTLLLRSPIKFKQCEESYCVPNVQPNDVTQL